MPTIRPLMQYNKMLGPVALALTACILSIAALACSTPEPTPTPLPPTASPPDVKPTELPPTPTPSPTPEPDPLTRFQEATGIQDPSNFGWPRTVSSSEGVVTLDGPPTKVHFLSLGHAEIGVALIGTDRLTAVYPFFQDPEVSNVSDLLADVPVIGFEPEEVVALEPDIVIASQFTNPDLVGVVQSAGIPVIRASEDGGGDGDIPNILLIAYALGAETRALELISEIETRLEYVQDSIIYHQKQDVGLPGVLAISRFTDIYAAGSNTNLDEIILAAGAYNPAAEAGIDSYQQVSIESIAAINPEMIIITQPSESAVEFAEELRASPVLQDVPAVVNGAVHPVDPTYFTTLSHWNVRGIEELAKLLYPRAFPDHEFADFEPYQP